MKIAIESNDGVTIKSPFLPTQGYIVYDIDQSDIVNSEYRKTNLKNRQKNGERKIASIISDTVLNDCTAIISRGMDRSNLDIFKKEGMDVYITFKTSTKDAVRLYMRELLISNKFVH